MPEARALVLRAAGTNCEHETIFGLETAGAKTTLRHVNRLLERPELLDEQGLLVIPGGFSYGDHLGAGSLLALELNDALGDHLHRFVERGGLVLGICNGFQVLVKTSLLPGLGSERRVTLAPNESGRYEDRWVRLAVDPQRCVFAPRDRPFLEFPVGHGEGRLTGPAATLDQLEANHQVVFRYVDAQGASPGYPGNPNGAARDIAGLCDSTGRVLGLMPHPDRALHPYNHPRWTREPPRWEGDGMALFRAAVAALTS